MPDVCIIELCGTVGDIESAPFIEGIRQLRRRVEKGNFLQIHVSLIPVVGGEQKTKPTQAAIREARSLGLQPDLVSVSSVIDVLRISILLYLAKTLGDRLPLYRAIDKINNQQNRNVLSS